MTMRDSGEGIGWTLVVWWRRHMTSAETETDEDDSGTKQLGKRGLYDGPSYDHEKRQKINCLFSQQNILPALAYRELANSQSQ
jgi:hypothetical protein